MKWKVKFIVDIIEEKLEIRNKKKAVINTMLDEIGFPKLQSSNNSEATYDYLLSMDLYKLTYEEVEELKKKRELKQLEYDSLLNKKPNDLWLDDLDEFEKAYSASLIEYERQYSESIPKPKKKKNNK
jgi:hypothetical protein